MNWIAIGILLLGGILLTVGDILMKNWTNSSKIWFYVIGMIFWILGLVFLAMSFKYKNIAVASIIFVLFNIITLALFSWLYFNEKLTALQMIGILLGLASVIILEFDN